MIHAPVLLASPVVVAGQPNLAVNGLQFRQSGYRPGDLATPTFLITAGSDTMIQLGAFLTCKSSTSSPVDTNKLLPLFPQGVPAGSTQSVTLSFFVLNVESGTYNLTGTTSSVIPYQLESASGVTVPMNLRFNATGTTSSVQSQTTRAGGSGSANLIPYLAIVVIVGVSGMVIAPNYRRMSKRTTG